FGGGWARDEGCVDLRFGADCLQRGGIGNQTPPPVQRSTRHMTVPALPLVPLRPPRRTVELKINDEPVQVPEGTTILDACRTQGKEIPTLCYLETLHPVNVCRLCVVEVEGSRVLVPSCSRPVEAGMVV